MELCLENIHTCLMTLTNLDLLIFLHLIFEETVDDIRWLRIKHPGTYSIHFDLIFPFSFALHTRDEIIHFSEHNPKHDINLVKGENCILAIKQIPTISSTGTKNICSLSYIGMEQKLVLSSKMARAKKRS